MVRFSKDLVMILNKYTHPLLIQLESSYLLQTLEVFCGPVYFSSNVSPRLRVAHCPCEIGSRDFGGRFLPPPHSQPVKTFPACFWRMSLYRPPSPCYWTFVIETKVHLSCYTKRYDTYKSDPHRSSKNASAAWFISWPVKIKYPFKVG